jgi:signal transduction histidine kinase
VDRRDAVIAAALTLVALAEVGLEPGAVPLPVAVGVALAMTVPLAWRRRGPLVVLSVVIGSAIVYDVVGGRLRDHIFFMPALMLAIFTAAYHLRRTPAIVGAAVAFLGATTQVVVEGGTLGDHVFGILVIGAAWVPGRILQTRKITVERLEAHAERLEREASERAAAAVAEERARIARELHDVVAHGVSIMVVQAAAAQQLLGASPERAHAALETIRRSGRESLAEMRRLVSVLRGSATDLELAPLPTLERVDALVDEVRRSGVAVTLRVDGDRRSVPAGVGLAAYRVVQEALTNVLTHSGAVAACIAIAYRPDELEIRVEDEGSGTVAGRGDGHGLIGMRERVTLYGGRFEAGPRVEGGFAVRVTLPIAPTER